MPTERRLALEDLLPSCRVEPLREGGPLGRVPALRGRLVLDDGCGDAHLRDAVTQAGGTYIGLDPCSGASDLRCAGDRIPLADGCVDVVISQAVLPYVPHPYRDVAEMARVMRPGAVLVGYAGFLEGNLEDARFLISHAGLAGLLREAGLELRSLSVAAYGMDQQLAAFLVPFARLAPLRNALRLAVRTLMRAWMSLLAAAGGWRRSRRTGRPFAEERGKLRTWFDLSHAAGFHFTAVKPGNAPAPPEPGDWSRLVRSPADGSLLRRLARADVRGLPPDASPEAREWLVDEAGRRAWPVMGRQLMLSRADGVDLA